MLNLKYVRKDIRSVLESCSEDVYEAVKRAKHTLLK